MSQNAVLTKRADPDYPLCAMQVCTNCGERVVRSHEPEEIGNIPGHPRRTVQDGDLGNCVFCGYAIQPSGYCWCCSDHFERFVLLKNDAMSDAPLALDVAATRYLADPTPEGWTELEAGLRGWLEARRL